MPRLDKTAPPASASMSVGVLATLSMDVAFLAASRVGGESFTSDKIGLEPVGRWVAGIARGRWRHEDMLAETPVHGEAAIGLAVHYLTGIILTRIYHEMLGRRGLRAGLMSATAFGAATALLPLVVMYPSWGLGPFAAASGETRRLTRIMLVGHSVFGAAIGLWTLVFQRRPA